MTTMYSGDKAQYVTNVYPARLRRIIVNSRCDGVDTFVAREKNWGQIIRDLEKYGKVPVYWLRPEDQALQRLIEERYPGRLLAEPWGGDSITLKAWTLYSK